MPNLFRLFLIVILLLTSQALASAKGQARIAGQIVLCVGETTITMQVDADGQPVQVVTICPDMALSLMQGMSHLATLPDHATSATSFSPISVNVTPAIHKGVTPRTRDPPEILV